MGFDPDDGTAVSRLRYMALKVISSLVFETVIMILIGRDVQPGL